MFGLLIGVGFHPSVVVVLSIHGIGGLVCNDNDGNLLAHQQLQLLEHGQALVKVGLVLLPLGQTGHLLIGVADGPHGVGIGAGELGDIGEEGAHVGGGIVAPAAIAH